MVSWREEDVFCRENIMKNVSVTKGFLIQWSEVHCHVQDIDFKITHLNKTHMVSLSFFFLFVKDTALFYSSEWPQVYFICTANILDHSVR